MRPVAAIVESSVDVQQLARAIAKECVALQECDRQLETIERKGEGLREQQRRHRVEIGRLLIEAKHGIKHGGWLPYLEKLGIESQRASEWMRLAGHVEAPSKSPTFSNGGNLPAPTLADAGIDKRPRKRDAEEIERDEARTERPEREPSLDIDAELSRIQNKICQFAESVPPKTRKLIAHELRETAKLIEEMP